MEIRTRPQSAVVPGGIRGCAAHARAGLAFGFHAAMHGRTDLIELHHDQRVEVVVERIAERRHENHRARRSRLVMVVHDLRIPFAVEHAIDIGAFRHVAHEEVAIVIVPDVLMPETGHAFCRSLRRVGIPHIPVGNEFLAIRIYLDEQDDHIVKEPHRLFIRAADHLVHHFRQRLCALDFSRVKAAVDPNHGLTLLGERMRLFVR